jgi:hypothetical protein
MYFGTVVAAIKMPTITAAGAAMLGGRSSRVMQRHKYVSAK